MNHEATIATLNAQLDNCAKDLYEKDKRIAELERQLAEASAPDVEQDKVICANLGELLLTPAQRKAADTDKVREADAWMTEDGERVVTNRTMEGARRDGGAMLSSMAPYSVALVRARSMAAQAPVREVPEDDGLTGKWCYSTDGEEFRGQCDTEQEAHNEACEYVDSGQPYWIGQIKHPADCIGTNRSIGDDIIIRADEAAYEECGGDDRAFEFSNEQCEQLGAMVREFIRREGSVNRWAVIDSKQYEAPAAPVHQEGA